MNKIIAVAMTIAAVSFPAYGEATPPARTETPIKFPILEMQYPNLRTTVKAPKVFWQINSEKLVPRQDHIISPLFYYQQTKK